MTEPFSTVGLVVILIWYAVIGLLAAAGSVAGLAEVLPWQIGADLLRSPSRPYCGLLPGVRGLLRERILVENRVNWDHRIFRPGHCRHTIRCRPDKRVRLARHLGRATCFGCAQRLLALWIRGAHSHTLGVRSVLRDFRYSNRRVLRPPQAVLEIGCRSCVGLAVGRTQVDWYCRQGRPPSGGRHNHRAAQDRRGRYAS